MRSNSAPTANGETKEVSWALAARIP